MSGGSPINIQAADLHVVVEKERGDGPSCRYISFQQTLGPAKSCLGRDPVIWDQDLHASQMDGHSKPGAKKMGTRRRTGPALQPYVFEKRLLVLLASLEEGGQRNERSASNARPFLPSFLPDSQPDTESRLFPQARTIKIGPATSHQSVHSCGPSS